MTVRAKVLIIGDSISMGYTPAVSEQLPARAEVVHNPGNGGDSDNVAANLDAWVEQAKPDVVHFNCGLHDIKFHRDVARLQVPLDRYQNNLRRIVARLGETGAKLVWASTTPVVESRHAAAKDFDRHNREVDAYNAAAAAIMNEAGIPIDDLYAAVADAGPERLIDDDGVHMTEEGYEMLAQKVAACLQRLL